MDLNSLSLPKNLIPSALAATPVTAHLSRNPRRIVGLLARLVRVVSLGLRGEQIQEVGAYHVLCEGCST